MSKWSKLNEESLDYPFFLIKNPIFELLRDVFWKNELIKSPLGICQGILHSILSILTYYGSQTDIPIKSYTRFKLKKNSIKKTFCHYEWRDPPREPCLAIFIGEFHQLLPRVQLANSIGKFPPKIDLL